MAGKYKALLQDNLVPLISAHGFKLDPSTSREGQGLFVFAKGEPAPGLEATLEEMSHIRREEIRIDRARWSSAIRVLLMSWVRKEFQDLGVLAGSPIEKWWPMGTSERAKQSLHEIVQALDAHAWDWFRLS